MGDCPPPPPRNPIPTLCLLLSERHVGWDWEEVGYFTTASEYRVVDYNPPPPPPTIQPFLQNKLWAIQHWSFKVCGKKPPPFPIQQKMFMKKYENTIILERERGKGWGGQFTTEHLEAVVKSLAPYSPTPNLTLIKLGGGGGNPPQDILRPFCNMPPHPLHSCLSY